jgi:hypothetical protein
MVSEKEKEKEKEFQDNIIKDKKESVCFKNRNCHGQWHDD